MCFKNNEGDIGSLCLKVLTNLHTEVIIPGHLSIYMNSAKALTNQDSCFKPVGPISCDSKVQKANGRPPESPVSGHMVFFPKCFKLKFEKETQLVNMSQKEYCLKINNLLSPCYSFNFLNNKEKVLYLILFT